MRRPKDGQTGVDMHYRAPLADMRFCLDHIVDQGRVRATGAFPALEEGVGEAILEEAARTLEERMAPAHRAADRPGARFANGAVATPGEFHDAYAALREGGYVGMRAREESGGLGLPQSLVTPINEVMGSCCLALSLCPLLTQGAIMAIEEHGSEELKAAFLPKLVDGAWAGTMNLTESHAGSDVGALATLALPDDGGVWRITGQKQFISWGESDLADNIVHLVLARTPDSTEGTAGLSLFVVPKRIPGADGEAGPRNDLKALSMEGKMGLHGSPTMVMSYDGARGWLLGEIGQGMRCMFTMMNAARLGVGVQGVSVAERALQTATAYAIDRKQGETGTEDSGIVGFPDVRRMLLDAHALTAAARALCYDLAVAIDLARSLEDPTEREHALLRQALLTPLAKAFGSDAGSEVADLALQIHGGTGYIENTGVAQLLRDARIASIYEGTNGIQALDLVQRRLPAAGGEPMRALLREAGKTADTLAGAGGSRGEAGRRFREACALAEDATEWFLECGDVRARLAGSTAYLRLVALARGCHYLGRGALAEEDGGRWTGLARHYALRVLPQTRGLRDAACAGAADLDGFPTADFSAGHG